MTTRYLLLDWVFCNSCKKFSVSWDRYIERKRSLYHCKDGSYSSTDLGRTLSDINGVHKSRNLLVI